MRSCTGPLRAEFLFPVAFWLSCTRVPLGFKASCSERLPSWCRTFSLGAHLGSKPSQSFGRTSVAVIIFLFLGNLSGGVILSYALSCLSSSSHRGAFLCLQLWESCSASLQVIVGSFSVSCGNFSVPTGGGELSRPGHSALPPSLSSFFLSFLFGWIWWRKTWFLDRTRRKWVLWGHDLTGKPWPSLVFSVPGWRSFWL